MLPDVWIIRARGMDHLAEMHIPATAFQLLMRGIRRSCLHFFFLILLCSTMKRLLLFTVASGLLNAISCAVGKTPLLLEKDILCQSKEVQWTHTRTTPTQN